MKRTALLFFVLSLTTNIHHITIDESKEYQITDTSGMINNSTWFKNFNNDPGYRGLSILSFQIGLNPAIGTTSIKSNSDFNQFELLLMDGKTILSETLIYIPELF